MNYASMIGVLQVVVALFCLFAFTVTRIRNTKAESRFLSLPAILAGKQNAVVFFIIGTSFAATLLFVWVLRAFPNSADEYGYIYGAETLLAGRLWNPLPLHHEFFSFLHIFEKDGKWVS